MTPPAAPLVVPLVVVNRSYHTVYMCISRRAKSPSLIGITPTDGHVLLLTVKSEDECANIIISFKFSMSPFN